MQIFNLDPDSEVPLFRQLYSEIRAAILSKRLPAGARLPSTRELALELGISRNTVMNAYEQLLAEGYLQGKTGSGSYVSELPESTSVIVSKKKQEPLLSETGRLLADTVVSVPAVKSPRISFRAGMPALELFPFAYWRKLLAEALHNLRARDFHYSDPAGYQPLRQELASYLSRNRGVRCNWQQILIVSGSQQAVDLCSRILLGPRQVAWIENPGYKGARAALSASGASVVPVPVDEEGFQWKRLRSKGPRLIYVTPSHQFPLGITMSLSRRLALLQLARDQNSLILEDDYDSEFRYDGRPLAALQGLDPTGLVLYIGTFSKVLFAGLRLGYLVVPVDLIDTFVNAKATFDRHSPILEQAAMASFIRSGRFERHIREMRKLYGKRQKVLIDAVRKYAPVLQLNPTPAGMHLVGFLPDGFDDRKISAHLAENGIDAPALSEYSDPQILKKGLLLGYSALTPARIVDGIQMLGRWIR